MGESDELPSALLTNAQRGYLRGEKEYRPSVEEEVRRRIRNRLRATMQDFVLVLRNLDVQDIQTALERRAGLADRERGETIPSPEQEEIRLENGMAAAIGVVYLAGLERSPPASAQAEDDLLTYTKFVVKRAEKGVRMALNRIGVSTESVDVNIDIELGQEFDALAGLDTSELAEYSMTELLQAHQAGTIDHDQFMGAMNKKGMVFPPDEEPRDDEE